MLNQALTSTKKVKLKLKIKNKKEIIKSLTNYKKTYLIIGDNCKNQ